MQYTLVKHTVFEEPTRLNSDSLGMSSTGYRGISSEINRILEEVP